MDADFGSRPIHHCGCARCQTAVDSEIRQYHAQINHFLRCLTEPQRRWYVAVLAQAPNAPSQHQLALITGLDRHTIRRGCTELAAGLPASASTRQRQPGGGRPCAEKKIPP